MYKIYGFDVEIRDPVHDPSHWRWTYLTVMSRSRKEAQMELIEQLKDLYGAGNWRIK